MKILEKIKVKTIKIIKGKRGDGISGHVVTIVGVICAVVIGVLIMNSTKTNISTLFDKVWSSISDMLTF